MFAVSTRIWFCFILGVIGAGSAFAQSVTSIEKQSTGDAYSIFCSDRSYGTVTVEGSIVCGVPINGRSASCKAGWQVTSAAQYVCSGAGTQRSGGQEARRTWAAIMELYRGGISSPLITESSRVSYNFNERDGCLLTEIDKSNDGINTTTVRFSELSGEIKKNFYNHYLQCSSGKKCVKRNTDLNVNLYWDEYPALIASGSERDRRLLSLYRKLINQ